MVDIFDEVDEELRAKRAQDFFKKYYPAITAACVAVVVGVAGWQGWNWYQARLDAAAARQYIAALTLVDSGGGAGPSSTDRAAALTGFEAVAASAPDGYRTLARLQAAALKAQAGDAQGAVALWDQVASDGSADPLLRELASLMWAERQLDTADPSLLEARLKPLTAPGSAWRSLAQEQLALLALRQGNTDMARTELRKLSQDVTAPAGVRGRAGVLASKLEEAQPVPKQGG